MLLRDKARNPNYEPNKQLNHIHANKKLAQETELKHWNLSVNSIPKSESSQKMRTQH